MQITSWAVVTSAPASKPTAVLKLPLTLLDSALSPMAVFSPPMVLPLSAPDPPAVLRIPVSLLKGARSHGCFVFAGGVAQQRFITNGCVEVAGIVAKERSTTGGRVAAALCVAKKRLRSDPRVALAGGVTLDRNITVCSIPNTGILISAPKPVAVLSTPVVLK